MKDNNKNKDYTKAFTVYGLNGCLSILNSDTCGIESVILSEEYKDRIVLKYEKLFEKYQNRIKILSKNKFNDKYDSRRAQGIAIYFHYNILTDFNPDTLDKSDACFVILDSIKDPQNFGQIIRTSECAGVNGIIIPERRSVNVTNTSLQVSQGAFCNLDIIVSKNIKYSINELKNNNFWVIGLENSIDSKNWCDVDMKGKIGFVFGSEGEGMRPIIKKYCDFLATIPMLGKVNSLNISATVSAILFERNRQLLKK